MLRRMRTWKPLANREPSFSYVRSLAQAFDTALGSVPEHVFMVHVIVLLFCVLVFTSRTVVKQSPIPHEALLISP